MLYGKLAVGNIKLANKSHSHQGFKHYNFSNLVIDDYKSSKTGLNFNETHFFLSSPDTVFIKSFSEGLLQDPEFRLHNEKFVVMKVEILEKPSFDSRCMFHTLSPIFTKTTREKNEELVEWELYPKDGKFHENIHNNLVKRYIEFYKKTPENDHFEILNIKDFKPKRIRIGNGERATFRRCSLMTFTVEANDELLRFAYDAGLGEKNAMGFGCIEVRQNV